ncbi:hypothetical protein BRARA_J00513, partial [Brassica rapa]
MPLEYTPLSQLNASQKEWKIRVLVSWVWNYYSKNKPEVVLGMEAILVDEKGERIQASVKQKLIKKFGRDLKEGEYLDYLPNLCSIFYFYVDILGEIVGMGEITERKYAGHSTKLLDIQLRDLSETIIECTLWENHAEDVHSYMKNNKTGPVILIGSLMRTKKFNGKISVQNSRFSTKLFLNEEDIDEISEFKKGMVNTDNLAPCTVTQMVKPTSNKV